MARFSVETAVLPGNGDGQKLALGARERRLTLHHSQVEGPVGAHQIGAQAEGARDIGRVAEFFPPGFVECFDNSLRLRFGNWVIAEDAPDAGIIRGYLEGLQQ